MKKIFFYEFEYGFGSIETQIENDVNAQLKIFYDNDVSFEIHYIPTGKGIIVALEFESCQ